MTIAPPAAAPASGSPATGSAAAASGSALAPLLLPQDLRLTPEQFAQVCEANPEAVLELAADGQLITMTPTGGETSARNQRLGQRLLLWADAAGGGAWRVFDSSGGFRLPDGSVLSLKDTDDEVFRAAEELGINISTRFESSSIDEI